jgi:hypothetical protein
MLLSFDIQETQLLPSGEPNPSECVKRQEGLNINF